MKRIITLFLSVISILGFSQTLTLPLAQGGTDGGGTLLTVDVSNGNYSAYSNLGTEGATSYNSTTGDIGGLTYSSANNSLYIMYNVGTREVGLVEGDGMVVRYDLNTNKTSTVIRFDFEDNELLGYHPQRGFTLVGNKLYGTCAAGGKHGDGVLFYIDVTNDSYHVLADFEESITGGNPTCPPIKVGNLMYGGGKHSKNGTGYMIYSYDLTLDTLINLVDQPAGSNDVFPIYGLYERNGFIYYNDFNGIESYSIANGTTQSHYNGTPGIGQNARGFTYNNGDGSWYTVFKDGGQTGKGSIGKIIYQSPFVINEHSFSTGAIHPGSALTEGLQGNLYGVIHSDSSSTSSKLYQLSSTGVYSELYTFSGGSDGKYVRMSPVLIGTSLYGISEWEGNNNVGVLWKYDVPQGTLTVLSQLGRPNGSSPLRTMVQTQDHEFIGIMSRGGDEDRGVIYSYNEVNQNLNSIKIIDSDLQDIFYQPFVYNNTLFALVQLRPNVATNYQSFSAIGQFDSTNNYFTSFTALSPSGINGVALPNSILYGTALHEDSLLYGATSKELWKFNFNTQQLTVLHTFNTSVDGMLVSSLVKQGNMLFGTTEVLGANNFGSAFSYDLSSQQFNVLYSPMNYALSNISAVAPDTLIGTSHRGGVNDHGVMFMLEQTTMTYTELASFDSATTGTISTGELIWNDGVAYGVSNQGHANGLGGVFSFDRSTNALASVLSFDQNTGYYGWNCTPFLRTSGIGINELVQFEAQLTPNPTQGILYIQSEKKLDYVEVYSITGKRVLKREIGQERDTKVDVADLSSGVYLVHLISGQLRTTHKIVKQ